jgi:hypothetical protein
VTRQSRLGLSEASVASSARLIEQVRSDGLATDEKMTTELRRYVETSALHANRVAGRTPAAAWRLPAGGGLARHGRDSVSRRLGLGLNVLFSLAGGADVADGRLSALSDVGVRALRTIALAA